MAKALAINSSTHCPHFAALFGFGAFGGAEHEVHRLRRRLKIIQECQHSKPLGSFEAAYSEISKKNTAAPS